MTDRHDEFKKALYALGETSLAHSIINRPVEPEDSERFQSIFAKNEGAVTAPTASLHFSRELMKRLEIKGIDFAISPCMPVWATSVIST